MRKIRTRDNSIVRSFSITGTYEYVKVKVNVDLDRALSRTHL